MQRHLVLVRHAKSAWGDASLADHDRPLAPRGELALPRLRDHLVRADLEPDLVLCSSARRTMDTLDGIRAALPERGVVEVDDEIYEADWVALLDRVRRTGGDARCTVVIGHNPTMQDLALLLVGAGDAAMRAQLATKLPTGAAVTLSFNGTWADLGPAVARLDDLFMPRRPRP